MKKILILSQYYTPIENAGAKRVLNIVKSLEENYDINVITGMPNYPYGKFYDGYNKFYKREGNIQYIWEYPTKNEGVFARLFNYISYPFLAFFIGLFKETDYIYATPPSVFISILGFVLAKIKRKKFILDVRDLWPESVAAIGFLSKESFTYKFFINISHYIYKNSDILVANSEGNQKVLKSITGKEVYLIKNAVSEKIKIKDITKDKQFKNKFLITYTGNHSNAQKLENIIYFAKEISHNKDIHFLFVGDGESKKNLLKLTSKEKLDNITFFDYRNTDEVNDILNYTDIGIFSLKDNKVFDDVMPSKIYEYMKVGLPVIGFGNGTVKNFINENELGFCGNNKNNNQFVDFILQIKNDNEFYTKVSENNIKFIEDNFSKESFKNDWLKIIKNI